MKKIMIILLVMLLMTTSVAFANKFMEIEFVELMDGKDGSVAEYNVVNLLIDGDDVFADVPAVLYELDGYTRTLVPISFITEKIGAGIAWNGDTQEVTITHDGNKIVLTVESSKAVVNGKTYNLPNGVPAKLMAYEGNYRTMVPVKFISEHLGYEIFWQGETKTVSINKPQQTLTAVRYDDSGIYPELRFKVSGEVSLTSFSVDGKSVGGEDTLTLDFHNTILDLKDPPKYGKFIINDIIQEIYDVAITQTSTTPMNVRAVVGLGYFRNGDVYYDDSTGEMVVQLINSVKYVDVEVVNGYNAVVIETNENPAFNVTNLGDAVYIDVINAKLSEKESAIIVQNFGIDSVTYEQFDDSALYDPGVRFSRIAVNLDNHTTSDNVFVQDVGSKIIVYVADTQNGTYNYAKDKQNATSQFGLDLTVSGSYAVNYNSNSHSVNFSVPKDQIKKNLEIGEVKEDDGIVNKIVVTDNGSTYGFQIYLVEETQYQEQSSGNLFEIAFTNPSLKNSQFRDMIIVVDAGHGGHDPGAVSPNGTKEKDVILRASLILKQKLENAGFKVYLTRERDNYVKLYDRAGIANQLPADIFISVHANAAKNTAAKGIETLYAPDTSRNNKALARAIQDQLIDNTNATDRGIVSRPDLVVTRETEMSAVLVELGFLTNGDEEIRLLSEAYLEKCAESIVEGIIDFVD
ncbi:MAG: N-acetylmuramoyl-L-alanine amidase [Clostridiales bacterium]|nr:N-acetylmuramoyl-L-alanine amidase [Clostridiales bacterium]